MGTRQGQYHAGAYLPPSLSPVHPPFVPPPLNLCPRLSLSESSEGLQAKPFMEHDTYSQVALTPPYLTIPSHPVLQPALHSSRADSDCGQRVQRLSARFCPPVQQGIAEVDGDHGQAFSGPEK